MVRSTRNKAILKAVDMNIKIDDTKSEINLSRLITEFSRSRTNAELYDVVRDEIASQAKLRKTDQESYGVTAPANLKDYWFNEIVHGLAHRSFHERRDSGFLKQLKNQMTPLEYHRINTVINTLVQKNSETNVQFTLWPVPGF